MYNPGRGASLDNDSQTLHVSEKGSEMADRRPNILFIMTDDHGIGALSCYGSAINETPHLDRIANGGMRLDNSYVTYSLCSPSRAAILTSKYAHLNGQTSIGGTFFDGSQQTFPKLLRQAGYQTAVVGKWYLHSIPTGFDHYSVMWNQGSYFDPAFIEPSEQGPVWKDTQGYSTDLVVDKCLDWLGGRDADKPFVLLCHFKSPHCRTRSTRRCMQVRRSPSRRRSTTTSVTARSLRRLYRSGWRRFTSSGISDTGIRCRRACR